MTPLTFALTETDLIRANRFALTSYLKANKIKNIAAVLILSSLVALIISIFDWQGWSNFLNFFAILLVVYVSIFVIIMAISWLILPKIRARKNISQFIALSREQNLSWNVDYFDCKSSNGKMNFPFNEIYKWASNETELLIYPADHIFYTFPAHIFENSVQRDEFIQLIAASGARRI